MNNKTIKQLKLGRTRKNKNSPLKYPEGTEPY
jgi:hypothetical protein